MRDKRTQTLPLVLLILLLQLAGCSNSQHVKVTLPAKEANPQLAAQLNAEALLKLEEDKPSEAISLTYKVKNLGAVASGTWTVSIVHDADVTLRFGDTNYDCTRIKTVYVADLGLATVKRTAFDFYAPDSGWVCQVFEQTVTKLIIPETTTGTWIIH